MDDFLIGGAMILMFANGLWLGWFLWRKPQLDAVIAAYKEKKTV